MRSSFVGRSHLVCVRRWALTHRVLAVVLCAVCVLACSHVRAADKNEGEGVQKTGPFGGKGPKDWATPAVPADCKLTSITFKVGKYVDQVRINYRDAKGEAQKAEGGGPGGETWLEPLEIPDGVRIVGITGSAGNRVDKVVVHLSNGDSKTFNGKEVGGKDFDAMLPKKEGKYVGRVIGFFGTCGDETDSIGIKYDPHE